MPFRPSETCLVCHSADLDRTARFYREAFDIAFEKRGSGRDAFLFARLSPDFSISFNQGQPEPGKSPIITFTLAEGGIADAVAALAANGATIVAPVSPAPDGHGAVLLDPDRHRLGLYQPATKPVSHRGQPPSSYC